MNIVFALIVLADVVYLMFLSPEKVLASISVASQNAVNLTLKMVGIYAVWLGIMALLDKSKVSDAISQVLLPPCKKLFGQMSPQGFLYTTMNFSANILGLGNAATPMGIRAAKEMKDNVYQLAMLMIINATGIQLLPTTVLSLMTEFGSSNPASIILPSILSTAVSTVFGVLLVMVVFKRNKKHE